MFGIYSSIVGTSSQGHYIGPAAAAFRQRTATRMGVGRGGAVLGRWCATSAAVHYLDEKIQYVRPFFATGTFMEPSD
jgi:hypothetical protein